MALSAYRNTPEMAHPQSVNTERGLAAAAQAWAGGIACKNAAGDIVPASTSTTLVCLGRFEETKLGSAVAGAVLVKIKSGVFRYGNSGASITKAHIGTDCFLVDDDNVHQTNGGATRSVAGKVFDVDSAGVWVLMGISN